MNVHCYHRTDLAHGDVARVQATAVKTSAHSPVLRSPPSPHPKVCILPDHMPPVPLLPAMPTAYLTELAPWPGPAA